MADLWAEKRDAAVRAVEPLALRMRPRTLDEFIGQRHILGVGAGKAGESRPLLRRMIEAGRLSSIILHGPPGTGKTTLAEVLAGKIDAAFVRENAAQVGVARIREIVQDAVRRLQESKRRTILFLDEIHRFSKAQQDVLLDDVERGRIILVGATTENPLFSVNSALLSRSTLFRLNPLDEEDVRQLILRAAADEQRGFGKLNITIDEEAVQLWVRMSEGDARRALNALEIAVLSALEANADEAPRTENTTAGHTIHITLADAEQSMQRKAIRYDRAGDQHYDHASAFIKSLRGSDPDAALYWLALMLEAGEDPRFIARRMAILASEDIGNADPRAIMVADAAWSLVERVGMPEARITLGQCATYLALAPKSNASYAAIEAALADVRQGSTIPVPMELRDKNKVESEGSDREGRGYEYSHNAEVRTALGGVTGQAYLGVDKQYYQPPAIGEEAVLRERLEAVRQARQVQRGQSQA